MKSDTELDEEVDNYFETKLRESCLKQLYPAIYDEECERYRILERVAGLFIYFLGIRGSLRIGPTGFRTFARLIQCSTVYFFELHACITKKKKLCCYHLVCKIVNIKMSLFFLLHVFQFRKEYCLSMTHCQNIQSL